MTVRNKLALTAAALSAVALLAGCGVGSGASEPTTQPSASTENLHGAPPVQNSLDTRAFQQKPCTVLSAEQLKTLNMAGVKGEAEIDGSLGPNCQWSDRFTGPSDNTIEVTFGTNGDGLKHSYSRQKTFSYFRELKPIEGYPAIAVGTTGGGTPEENGTCSVEVGVTNDLSVLTQITLGDGSPYAGDPCGRARDVATEVVKTLKAGA